MKRAPPPGESATLCAETPRPQTPRRATLAGGLLRITRSLLFVYLSVLFVVYLVQRRLQYFPTPQRPPIDRDTPERGLSGLEEVTLTAADGVRLEAWYWPGEEPLTLVIFHGNGGHRGHRLEWIQTLHTLGWGIFIVDYRGYGGSEGSPTEEGLYHDGEAALAWLENHSTAKRGKLVFLGESLGGGVAVEMARRHPPAALILQSAFSSAVDVGQTAYPFLPVGWLMKDRYENTAKIGEIRCPLLMIHGDSDRIVPRRFGRRLFDAAGEPKEWYEVARAGHNDLTWVGGKAYLERIDDFLRKL